MTLGEFANKLNATLKDAPVLRDAIFKGIDIVARHETEGILVAFLYSNSRDGKDYITTVAYDIFPTETGDN